jgi:hypothetical protein
MTVVDDITKDLIAADSVEATAVRVDARRYALEAGMRICAIPAVRAARVDSAVLVGFIFNTTMERPPAEYTEMAALIVAEFGLDEVAR